MVLAMSLQQHGLHELLHLHNHLVAEENPSLQDF